MTSDMNAILIRQYVDGELAEDARAEFEARLNSDTDLQAAVAFERSLRDRVRDVLADSAGSAPAGLREQIVAAMAAADFEDDVPVIGTIEPGGASNSLDARPWRGWAVAASLLLVASAVLFGIFGPSINDRPATSIAEVAEQAADEHRSCATNGDTLNRKLVYQDEEQARVELSNILFHEVTIFDLDNDELDYQFIGGAECRLPGCVDTVHLLYGREATESRGGALVSVYLTRDEGHLESLPKCPKGGFAWKLEPRSKKCSMEVAVCRDTEMIYVICCCDSRDREAVRLAIERQLKANQKNG